MSSVYYSVIEGTCGLVDIIEKHRSKSLDQDVDNTYGITVRHSEIWKDAIQSFKWYFDESKHLRFTFLGEPAVNDGGPKREFIMLFINCLNSHESLFEGPLNRRVLKHTTSALDKRLYKIVGKIIAFSVIHGGPGLTSWLSLLYTTFFKVAIHLICILKIFPMIQSRYCSTR